MKIKESDRDKIINFGAFKYDPEKMANILGLNIEDVSVAMNDENSEFKKLYNIGADRADYVIDLKLFEMAQTGDIKALDKLEMRKRMRK